MSGRYGAHARGTGMAAAAVAVSLTLGASAVVGASPTDYASGGAVTSALSARTGVFNATAAPLPVVAGPTAAGVTGVLAAPLSDPALGAGVVASVMDPNTGAVLYDSGSTTPTIPASSLKILTSAAALENLGVDEVLSTRVVQEADGTLILVGAGDPELRRESDGSGASLDLLAARTVQALGTRASAAAATSVGAAAGATSGAPAGVPSAGDQPTAPVRVAVDDSLFTGPTTVASWPPAVIDECLVRPITALAVQPVPGEPCQPVADPALSAGEMFVAELTERGIVVAPGVTRGVASAAATPIAAIDSLPVSALVESMMLDSDNTAAEMLAHLAGGRAAGQASFTGGTLATAQVVAKLGIPAAGITLVDASGLSREDAVPPATIAAALVAVVGASGDVLWPAASGLPVAGFDGTLSARFDTPATAVGRGDVRAKTGTLTGVSALAGQVVTAQGQLLVFVFITPTAGDTTAARAALDSAASALAGCGCG